MVKAIFDCDELLRNIEKQKKSYDMTQRRLQRSVSFPSVVGFCLGGFSSEWGFVAVGFCLHPY